MIERDWYKCYGQGWGSLCVPAAYAHPAKFSRALIRRIYDHLFEQGYLHEDDIIVDPFGGIALGALHAMQHGCHWIGCELEDRFVQLGQQNIDLWNERYAPHFPKWGSAIIVQGDSRELAQVVGQVAGASISSPPYNLPMSQDHNGSRGGARGTTPSEKGAFVKYGNTPGQLEGLPMKDADHAAQVQGSVSSPPYESTITASEESTGSRSPKWVAQNRPNYDTANDERLNNDGMGYGETDGQLGREQGDTFWSAAKTIVEQTYQVLAPGAVAVWVCKSFVRKKKRVDFPNQWRELGEACGFETVEMIRAWLVEDRGAQFTLFDGLDERKIERKSFFRRLHEFSARAKKFWNESVSRDDKALHLWLAHNALWENYRLSEQEAAETGEEIEAPYPTKGRILHNAQKIAYEEAGEPDLETGVEIDYEVVIIQRKPGG